MVKKVQEIFGYITIVVLIVFVLIVVHNKNDFSHYVDGVNLEYTGVVEEIYYLRSYRLKIKTNSLGYIDIGSLSVELVNNVEKGDSIQKIPNQNCVVIWNMNKKVKSKYLYIDEKLSLNRSWPKDLILTCEE
jgi:hypothetical protein